MRVIAGSARGRPLKGPRGAKVRPTADKVKGAMFSMIETQLARLFPERDDVWQGTRVLDLYAGSGALGIEALSRGASWADFVDRSEDSIRLVRENLARTDLASRAGVHRMRVEQAVSTRGGIRDSHDMVLLDAPYSDPSLPMVLQSLATSDLVAERAVIVVEHSRRQPLPDELGYFRRIREKRYGDTIVSVYVRDAVGRDAEPGAPSDVADPPEWDDRPTAMGKADRSPAEEIGPATVRRHTLTTAVYPGSFDPITCGHVDIATRAAAIFDKLVVAVYDVPAKHLMFTTAERVAMAREALAGVPNVDVISYHDLTVEVARRVGAQVIVRGLRAVSDFEVEMQMALLNRKMAADLEVVCLMTSIQYSFLSATMIKEIVKHGGPTEGLVPDHVADALRQKFRESRESTPIPRYLGN